MHSEEYANQGSLLDNRAASCHGDLGYLWDFHDAPITAVPSTNGMFAALANVAPPLSIAAFSQLIYRAQLSDALLPNHRSDQAPGTHWPLYVRNSDVWNCPLIVGDDVAMRCGLTETLSFFLPPLHPPFASSLTYDTSLWAERSWFLTHS